ncbi:MAG: response regulator [Verrucomicrobiota bacterium]
MFFSRRKSCAEAVKPASAVTAPEPAAPVPSNGKRILVADDDPVVLQALTLKLKSLGYQVLTARDGSEAITSTRTTRPDLMLLDVDFPPDVSHGGGVPWNGFLICEWVQRVNSNSKIPFIMISGADRAEFKQRASAAGAAAFLPKPINGPELEASIHSALAVRG